MTMWELEEFQGPRFLGYVRNIPTPDPWIGSSLLPDRQTFDLSFDYILASDNRPVMAHIISWGSEAPLASRDGLGDRVIGELPPIKRKIRISEKELARFMTPRAGTPDKQTAIDAVYDDVRAMVQAVQARVEWLRIQALSEDTVTYSEDGITFSFDFGLTDTQQLNFVTMLDGESTDISSTYSTVWSDLSNSNWVLDLQVACDAIESATGFRPARMLMRPVTYSYMTQNTAAMTLLRGPNSPTALLSDVEMAAIADRYGIPQPTIYRGTMRSEAGDGTLSTLCPLADGKVILLPGNDATLGWTLWGPTAESTRALLGTPLANEAPGVWANTYAEEEPPQEFVKAAAVAFPSLPGANLIGQITAHA